MPDGNVQLTDTGYTYDPDAEDMRDPFRSFLLDQAREQAERDVAGAAALGADGQAPAVR